MDSPARNFPAPAGDDRVRPFQVEGLDVRGRAVQLGPALDAILARHAYPVPVSKVLAEAIVLVTLLGSSIKFEGKLILQTQTDGPISMLVVDYRPPGKLRAYARFDREAVAAANGAGTAALVGKGVLAFTIDPGAGLNRYQGVVELNGSGLEEAAHVYFRQSEQIPTRVRLAAAELFARGDAGVERRWRAGGVLAQFLPEAGERVRRQDLPGGDAPKGREVAPVPDDEAWAEAQALISTVEDHELTDPEVPVDRLLFRLFHERGVRVFEPIGVADECSCSRERVDTILKSFTGEEIADSVEDGEIVVTCEFCGEVYRFDPAAYLGQP